MTIYVGNVMAGGGGTVTVGIMVDTTGSMPNVFTLASTTRAVFIDRFDQGPIGRFVMGDFRDFSSRTGASIDYPYNIIVPLTSDIGQVDNFILSYGSGGDTPETIWSAIVDGLINVGGLSNGAAIIVSDAYPLNPEPITNYTTEFVISTCLSRGIKVYGIGLNGGLFVTDGGGATPWSALVNATGGTTISAITSGYSNALQNILNIVASDF